MHAQGDLEGGPDIEEAEQSGARLQCFNSRNPQPLAMRGLSKTRHVQTHVVWPTSCLTHRRGSAWACEGVRQDECGDSGRLASSMCRGGSDHSRRRPCSPCPLSHTCTQRCMRRDVLWSRRKHTRDTAKASDPNLQATLPPPPQATLPPLRPHFDRPSLHGKPARHASHRSPCGSRGRPGGAGTASGNALLRAHPLASHAHAHPKPPPSPRDTPHRGHTSGVRCGPARGLVCASLGAMMAARARARRRQASGSRGLHGCFRIDVHAGSRHHPDSANPSHGRH